MLWKEDGLTVDLTVSFDFFPFFPNYCYRTIEFMSIVNDPVLKLQSTVHKLLEVGLIKYRNKNKEVFFNTKTNKTRLCTIPYGEDPIYIVSSFFQSDDGIESLKHLEKMLDN